MKKLLNAIKKNATKAYKIFEAEIEVDDAKALAKELKAQGDTETASIIGDYIKAYNAGTEYEYVKPVKIANKAKGKVVLNPRTGKPIYGPYHENGGLGVLDAYADWLEYEYDAYKHVSSRYRYDRMKDTAETRCKYLRKLWLAAIDQAREDGEQNWFTRIVRHQVCAQTKADLALREKTLKGIPKPSEA